MIVCRIFIICLCLAGCGWQAVYHQPSDNTRHQLAAIDIAPMRDRIGQEIRSALIDRVAPYPNQTPRYRLIATWQHALTDLGLQSDNTATLKKYTLSIDYTLVDLTTGAVALQDNARASTSYNILESEYANLTAEKDAGARLAIELAEAIRLRLGVYFANQS